MEAIQEYVDATLGDSSVNTCYEVDTQQAFAERPLELRLRPAADEPPAEPRPPQRLT